MNPLAALRRLPRHRVLSAVVFAVVVHWFTLSTAPGRLPGGWFVITAVVGMVLFVASVLRVVHRAATASPPPTLRPLAPHAETFLLLTALNLAILSFFAPAFVVVADAMASNRFHNPIVRQAFEAVGTLSGGVLTFVFSVGIVAVAWVLLVRFLRPALRRSPGARRLGAALDRALVAVIVLFCATSLVLTYNARLDAGAPQPRRAELVAISSLPVPFTDVILGWADVRYSDTANRVERLLLWPNEDVWPGRVGPGLPLLVDVRPGLFGIPWVQAIRIDHERDLRRSLAAVPTATTLRKALVTLLTREHRWDEVIAETEAHLRAYPEDHRFVLAVSTDLRAQGQPALALRLERLIQP